MDYAINFTVTCETWLAACKKKDRATFARIVSRIARIAVGNFGDHRSVGDEVSELRLDFGPGYRVYYTIRQMTVVIVLCGGDKASQSADIAAAKKLAKDL